MARAHEYEVTVTWTGNQGSGTSGYRDYGRSHEVTASGPPLLEGSADASFRGDAARWNPEQLLVASLSQCHMLWYLHLCATSGVVVTAYADRAEGTMAESADGSGRFTEVVLRPRITVTDEDMLDRAAKAHDEAHRLCFIANSVNFPVRHEPAFVVA
ncbi:MAG: OsmC family protein [Streptosporangiales bacterium]|nr:OsmC family protein [Streptosporangiales bacterium]